MAILMAKKKRRRPWGSPDIIMKMSVSTIIKIIVLASSVSFCALFAEASSASEYFHYDQYHHQGGSSISSTSLAGRNGSNDEVAIEQELRTADRTKVSLEGSGNDEEYQEGEEWEESIDNNHEAGSQYRTLQEFDEEMFFDEDLFANGSVSPAEEENVTPTPSFQAGLASSPVAIASMPPAGSPSDETIGAPSPEPSPPTPVTVSSRAPFEIPLNFNLLLRVPKDDDSMDLTDLLRRTELALESYLTKGLTRVETEVVEIQTVSLIATFWGLNGRRRLLRGNAGFVELLRSLQADEQQELNVEVTGGIEFAIEEQGGDIQDPGSLKQIENSLRDKVENELNFLLKEENLDEIGRDVVAEAFGGDIEDENEQDNPDDADDNGGDDRNGDIQVNNNQVGNNSDEIDLEQPTLISIIFGFALLGLATAGLCAYGYICCKKRRKRLRKRQQMKKQMKESIQYKLPTTSNATNANSVGSKRSLAPSSVGKVKTPKPTPNKGNDADSESSSYNGLGTDSTSVPGDSFARELQLAASLDQQAWDDIQRKKSRSRDSEDRQGAISANPSGDEEAYVAAAAAAGLTVYNARSPSTRSDSRASPSNGQDNHNRNAINTTGSSSSSRWPRSFPYGDEEVVGEKSAAANDPYGDDFPDDEGMDWASQDDDDDWDEEGPGTSRGSSGKNTSSFLESSRAMIDRIGKNFEMYGMGTTNEDEMEDPNADNSRNTASLLTTDIVQEVERLSKFVKRYEMKKERRVKRQQERSHKFGDVSYDETSGNTSRSPHDGQSLDSSRENRSHLQNRTPFASSPPSAQPVSNRLRSKMISDAEARYGGGNDVNRSPTHNQQFDSDARELAPDPSLNHDATLSASDSESEVSDRRQVGQERLGITPFSVQKPNGAHHLSYQQERGGTHLENGDSRFGALASLRGQTAVLDESKINGHSRGRHSTGGRLSALRSNDAILDSSQSDVGASYPVAYDDTAAIRSTQPSRGGIPRRNKSMPSNRPKHTKKFNNIRAMFEKTADQKDPIFPPDQHWQFTSFAAKG